MTWRRFLVLVRGLLSRDTPTATLVLRSRPGGPAQFENWLKARAVRKKV